MMDFALRYKCTIYCEATRTVGTGEWSYLRNEKLYDLHPLLSVGRDSSVGIRTTYGLEGPGIESLWGRDFPHPFRPALGPFAPPVHWVPCHSQVKAAGAWD